MIFKRLRITNWRQFADIDIKFSHRVTVITGANGCGKTITLSILASHYTLIPPYTAIPVSDEQKFQHDVLMRPYQNMNVTFGPLQETSPGVFTAQPFAPIGMITYSDDSETQLSVPLEVDRVYKFALNRISEIIGLHFGAFDLSPAPVLVEEKEDAELELNSSNPIQLVSELLRPMNEAAGNLDARLFQLELKKSLLRWLTLCKTDQKVLDAHHALQAILASCLPAAFKFVGLEKRAMEIVVQTETAEFSFDASSAGISRVITLVWRIFLLSLVSPEFVVTIDEPENHLHPSMQQSLLSGLSRCFPQVQFVIATHSPFMVTAVPDASIFAFVVKDRDVVSRAVHPTETGALTPDEVFRDILGMPFTMPIWAEQKLQTILDKYQSEDLTQNQIGEFVTEIQTNGLSSLVPAALHVLLQRSKTVDPNS